jgi:hypothetical protein
MPHAAIVLQAQLNGAGGSLEGGDGGVHPHEALCSAVLPGAFSLAQTVHALWSPSCAALPPQFRPLLGMRRSDFWSALQGAGKSFRRELTPEVP